MKVRKKPIIVEAFTFDELVEWGKTCCTCDDIPLVAGMPWSFNFRGHPITNETDDCYLIPTLGGTNKMNRLDMLIVDEHNTLSVWTWDDFRENFEIVAE